MNKKGFVRKQSWYNLGNILEFFTRDEENVIGHDEYTRCKIWGFHGGDYEEWCLLGCYAVWLL
jgi:hypothetical protein